MQSILPTVYSYSTNRTPRPRRGGCEDRHHVWPKKFQAAGSPVGGRHQRCSGDGLTGLASIAR